MAYYSKIIILFMFVHTYIYASNHEQKYGIESATIEYMISGGGVLTSETNLTIQGTGKLHFKEWGKVELFEEMLEEIALGAINNIETMQVCKKINHDRKSDVDFKNKKILERQISEDKNSILTSGLVQKGQQEIVGYKCDLWEGNGIKKCIYKGIPLLIEYGVLGMTYQKKAVRITTDINTSLNSCTIPNYPVQKFSLFKNNIKTTSKKLPKEFSKRLIEISKKLHKVLKDSHRREKDISLQKQKIWLNKLAEDIFKKQKILLPKLLFNMKKTRMCLQQAENWISANICIEDLIVIKKYFTKDKQSNIESWKGEEKLKILDTFDTNISLLEGKMRCIRSAQNITDLSSCMK